MHYPAMAPSPHQSAARRTYRPAATTATPRSQLATNRRDADYYSRILAAIPDYESPDGWPFNCSLRPTRRFPPRSSLPTCVSTLLDRLVVRVHPRYHQLLSQGNDSTDRNFGKNLQMHKSNLVRRISISLRTRNHLKGAAKPDRACIEDIFTIANSLHLTNPVFIGECLVEAARSLDYNNMATHISQPDKDGPNIIDLWCVAASTTTFQTHAQQQRIIEAVINYKQRSQPMMEYVTSFFNRVDNMLRLVSDTHALDCTVNDLINVLLRNTAPALADALRQQLDDSPSPDSTHDRSRYVAELSDWVTNVAQLLAAELERESFRAAFRSQTSGGGGGSRSSRHRLNTAGFNRSTDRSTGPKHSYNNNGRGRGRGRGRGHNNSSERTGSNYNNNNRGRGRGRGRSSRSWSYNPNDYDRSKPCRRSRCREQLVDEAGKPIPHNNREMPNCNYFCHFNNCVRNNSAGVHHQFIGRQMAAHTGAETHCQQRAR